MRKCNLMADPELRRRYETARNAVGRLNQSWKSFQESVQSAMSAMSDLAGAMSEYQGELPVSAISNEEKEGSGA